MDTFKNSWKLIMPFLMLTGYFQVSAQVSSVNNYLSKINSEVSQINQLAGNKKVYEAIAQLNETRRDLDQYVNYYLEDEMRKAKAENSGFAPNLSVSFSNVLTAAYWEDRVRQAQKSIDLAESAFSERNYQRTLDSQDQVWSYLVAVYGVGKTIKDVIENVEQAKFYDAIKSAKEGVDGFIEDYKKIEEARLQIINTQLYEINIRGLIQKGKRMEETCWQFSSFMRAYEQDVNDFYQVVNRFNQKINEIGNEVEIDLSGGDYSWSGQKYLNQINSAANQFKAGKGNYETIKSQIEAINEKAEADKDQVSQNLYNSGAANAFEKVNELEEDFNEFYDLSIDVLDECYRFDQKRGEVAEQATTEINIQNNIGAIENNSAVNSGGLASSGRNLENNLYHNYWESGIVYRGSFKQKGNIVEIEGVGTGTISDGVLYYKYNESDGTPRTDIYQLTGKGYTMEVSKEWSNDMIIQEWKVDNSSAPTQEQIDNRKARKGKYLKTTLKYSGNKKANLQDSDGDQVADEYDNCPNTPQGSTVTGGEVDIAGCPKGNVMPANTETAINTENKQAGSANVGIAITQNEENVQPIQQTTPPGKRIPNKLYHSYWSTDVSTIQLKQNGNTVEIVGIGTGQIINGSLIYSYKDSNGSLLNDEYHLVGDGYSMEVKKQRPDNVLKNELAVVQNIFSPTTQQLDNYRAKYGYEVSSYGYNGLKRAGFGQSKMGFSDSDSDQVPDECDNCPNSPAGLTVDNGGVDIAGCPTRQNVSTNQATANVSGKNNQQLANTPANSMQPVNPNNSVQAKTSAATNTNAFAGAGAVSKTSTTPSNSASQNTSNQTTTKKGAEKISSAANKMPKTGASSMARIPVYKLMENDKLVLRQTGGSFLKFYVRWVGVNFSEVLYDETKQIVFSTTELLAKRPEKAAFLDLQVNQYSDVHCYMEAWVFPQGVPIPAEWNIKDNSGSNVSNNGGNDFYELIKKADEAFNKKYWDESQGVRSSSNPKQESLDFLRKAEPIINQEQDISQRYSMVLTLASKYAEYAKRVFVNSAKNEFIQRAGSLLSKYGSSASSLANQKATAYNEIAEGWRELTKAAMWGGHQYNKTACDIEAKKYYDLALREDRSNVQLQKTVEKINAPKKPVPAAVAATKPIPESAWANAENRRNMIVQDIPVQEEDGPHYLEIGLMKLDMGSIKTGSGKVWLLRSGSENWELLTKTDEFIFTGDKIKTADDARNVYFDYSADKTHLAILPGSIVTFEENQLYIQRGDVYVRIVKKGGEFLLITPTAVLGPRGTEFSVNVDNSGSLNVHLYEGAMEMRNSTEISYLVPGQTAKIEKDDAEIQVTQFNIQQHKQQYVFNQNQSKSPVISNPFQFVTGGGKIIGGN